ncbi:MAG TPA: 1-acyl-sn-glycerol-3-phosphate acyltransferase [Desulfobacterales bacterium]|nr:1-acyl-sn-glycerol-3-phosphate acyltransferase [Desulfobacterales bacterium]
MAENNPQTCFIDTLCDVVVTVVCWFYFIFAFLFFFSFFYAAAFFFSKNREQAFQYLDHLFFKGFLYLLRILAPRQRWEIDQDIGGISGSIIVCNHLSYLDPLILISLLPRQKTIVKTKFFRAPVFGWLIKISGYLPATTEGVHAGRMIEHIENMGEFLKSGGNLFVFPEGTRNPDTILGDFHKGVFKIGRMYNCPIHVLNICNTYKLFTPGKFFFNTRIYNHISIKIIGCVNSVSGQTSTSAALLEKEVREIFENSGGCREGTQ